MAVAAFKSSSRRPNQSSTPPSTSSSSFSSSRPSREEPHNRAPIRRSRSVSAFSRTNLDISTEFLNKRDNPLFSSTASPRDDEIQSTKTLGIAKFDKISRSSAPADTRPADSGSASGNARRGRSVARNGEGSGGKGSLMGRKETGRSLSRVDMGRRNRSASQCPVSRRHFHYSTSESEAESKDGKDLKLVGSNRKGGLFRSKNNDVLDQVKDLQTWSTQHLSTEASDCSATTLSGLQTQNCEDAVSTASSGYGSDEKTIKEVCDQMMSIQADPPEASDIYETVRSEVRRAISEIQNDLQSAMHRSNATPIAVTNVIDIPPDLVNPGAVELVLEIRREYAEKLEESQERARKLRADLAVEEHRGQELDRILKEVLPYPKTPNVQKSHPSRKASIERRRMSKRLAEDARAYFDECVSLSTFDSSDLSSQEDPPLNLVGPPTPFGSHVRLPKESGIRGQSMGIHYDITQPSASISSVKAIHGQISSIPGSPETDCHFSFAQKPSETSGLQQQDIQQYIKKFEKNVLKLSTIRSNYCDLQEYSYQPSVESLLIDRVLMKNRIESGNLLLCGGGSKLSSKSCGMSI